MEKVKFNSFFLVIPTRERVFHLKNLLTDFNSFALYISQCIIVDQSVDFVGDDFDYSEYNFPIKILRGDRMKGVNHSRNKALEEYKGEDWLFFLDDDLRVASSELKNLVEVLQTTSFEVVIPGINEVRKLKDSSLRYNSVLESILKPQSFDGFSNRIIVSSGLCVIKKNAFLKFGAFDEVFTFWGDDWDLGVRLYRNGATIKYIPSINFTHLQLNIGGQRSFKENIDVASKKKELYYYFLKKHFSKSVLKESLFLDMVKSLRKFKILSAIKLIKFYKNAHRL